MKIFPTVLWTTVLWFHPLNGEKLRLRSKIWLKWMWHAPHNHPNEPHSKRQSRYETQAFISKEFKSNETFLFECSLDWHWWRSWIVAACLRFSNMRLFTMNCRITNSFAAIHRHPFKLLMFFMLVQKMFYIVPILDHEDVSMCKSNNTDFTRFIALYLLKNIFQRFSNPISMYQVHLCRAKSKVLQVMLW